ncbi:MAG: EscU/YscU/HrcU family type III secretion system export apparatus switch protein [Bacillota bacterium]|nr:EscU/YscU/HrcU family type III secretion system export apparatus switch protein [Bacillota bacterium]
MGDPEERAWTRRLDSLDLQLFSEEKREMPTQRRRQEARRRGQVVHSGEVGLVAVILSGSVALRWSWTRGATGLQSLARDIWSQAGSVSDAAGFRRLMESCLAGAGFAVLPVLALLTLASLAGEVAQVGFSFSAEPVSPKLSRLSPLRGLARIFSRKALLDLLKAVLKTLVIAEAVGQAGRAAAAILPGLAGAPLREAFIFAGGIIWSLALRCCLGLAAIAAGDYFLQWRENETSLMMTRREMLDEIKETEGRPEVRQRLRSRQRQLARGRMILAVRKADVVVVNPEHFAVALQYEASKTPAPVVIAKGAGQLALRIKEQATRHRVAVVENAPVARALFRSVDVGELIPPVLYHAVAEVLAFVYRLRPEGSRQSSGAMAP